MARIVILSDQDLVKVWFTDRCTPKVGHRTKSSEIYEDFVCWKNEVRQREISPKKLSMILKTWGFTSSKLAGSRALAGFCLKSQDIPEHLKSIPYYLRP